MASDKSQTELSSISFPLKGSLHPLGNTIDFVSIQMENDPKTDAYSSSSLCTMQSSDWSKPINMTAVITGINEDGLMSATSSIASSTNVVYMEKSAQSLKTASTRLLSSTFPLTNTVMNLIYIDDLVDSDGGANRGKQQALLNETISFLIFVSAGVHALLGHKSISDMVHCC